MLNFIIPLSVLLLALLVCSGGLIILFMQKVVVNESGEISSIELPILGKLSTNYPSLLAVFLGVSLAFAVLYTWSNDIAVEWMTVTAEVTLDDAPSNFRKDLIVGLIPPHYRGSANSVEPGTTHKIKIAVPKLPGYDAIAYTVLGIDDNGQTQVSFSRGSVSNDGNFKTILRAVK